MLRRSWLRWLVPILVLMVTALWYVIGPRRAYRRFLDAVAISDTRALRGSIDYATLRESFRHDLSAAIAQSARARGERADKALGQLLEPMLNTITSNQGLAQVVTSLQTPSDIGVTGLPPETSYRYRSLFRVDVRVHPPGRPAIETGIFTFRWQGIRWRLTRIWSERIGSIAGDQ